MFERFTERARQVVRFGADEARALKHAFIGTEHLLLGLLREEEGVAAKVLERLGVTVEEVRAEVARIVGQGDEVTTGQIPFTPRVKKVLELALREALTLGDMSIGTEHLLLGLIRENQGLASRILLVNFNADAEKVRGEVIRFLKRQPGTAEAGLAVTEAVQAREEVRGPVAPVPARWEYHVLSVERVGEIPVADLNSLGSEGWELVALTGEVNAYRLIFKRPKREGIRRVWVPANPPRSV